VSGSTVTLVAAGVCTIMASQAGNQAYNAAQSVTQSFVVYAHDGATPYRMFLPLLAR
jgi:hypothetical protein